jgi:hypothetical protein
VVLALATFWEIDDSQFESANIPDTLVFRMDMGPPRRMPPI